MSLYIHETVNETGARQVRDKCLESTKRARQDSTPLKVCCCLTRNLGAWCVRQVFEVKW